MSHEHYPRTWLVIVESGLQHGRQQDDTLAEGWTCVLYLVKESQTTFHAHRFSFNLFTHCLVLTCVYLQYSEAISFSLTSFGWFNSIALNLICHTLFRFCFAATMIIPIRCFTCGKVIGSKWEAYLGLLQAEYTEG